MSNKPYGDIYDYLWATGIIDNWEKTVQTNDTDTIDTFITEIINSPYLEGMGHPLDDRLSLIECCIGEYEAALPEKSLAELRKLGGFAYSDGDFTVAEKAFRILSNNNDTAGRTRYARMIRRKEVSEKDGSTPLDALRLLRKSIEDGDPLAFVETALTFALCFGGKDWQIADYIMEKLPPSFISDIEREWVYCSGYESEQALVYFFLLRHAKVFCSELGDATQLSMRLTNEINGFSDWWLKSPSPVAASYDEGAEFFILYIHQELAYEGAKIHDLSYILVERFAVNGVKFCVMVNENDPLDTIYCKLVDNGGYTCVRLLDLEREKGVIAAYQRNRFEGGSNDIYTEDW